MASSKSKAICFIQLSKSSTIRLHGFPYPPEILAAPLRAAICAGWKKGIEAQKVLNRATIFELKGCPWSASGEDGVDARRLLVSILKAMAVEGWNLIQACDITTKLHDKDTMFFEFDGKRESQASPMFAVSFNRWNRIRLITLDNKIEECVLGTFKSGLNRDGLLKVEAVGDYHGAVELILNGTPWNTSKAEESIATKVFLCQFLHVYQSLGYKLYASVDMSTKDPHPMPGLMYWGRTSSDMETWVFRKVTDLWGK